MSILSFLFKKTKKVGCPNCYQNEIISFGIDHSNKFTLPLVVIDRIGLIPIYQCEKCLSKFFIQGNLYTKIFEGQIELAKIWKEKKLLCPENLKPSIEKIGPSEDWNSNKIVPCSITLKNETQFDFVRIQISVELPLGYFYTKFENIFFIDDVNEISESEYGLSKEIRSAARKSEEKRMGFYPTVLKDKKQDQIVINGISLFFNSHQLKGSELELANTDWNHTQKYIYEENDFGEGKNLVIAKG